MISMKTVSGKVTSVTDSSMQCGSVLRGQDHVKVHVL